MVLSTIHTTVHMNVKQLLERYSFKSRQSLYDRLNALSITLSKDENGASYATPDQLDLQTRGEKAH